jgi:hypothetical protein
MDKSLFEAVQQKLSANQSHKTLTRQKSDRLLKDLLFDDAGPSHDRYSRHQGWRALSVLCLSAGPAE